MTTNAPRTAPIGPKPAPSPPPPPKHGYTPAGPPLAPIAPPRGGTGESRQQPIDVNLRITMTEDEASATLAKHGCILAQLEGGPNNDPMPILAGMSESQTAHTASELARTNPGVQYGIYKLARIIIRKKIE